MLVVFVVQALIRGFTQMTSDRLAIAQKQLGKTCGPCQDWLIALVHLTWITGEIMHARIPAMLCFSTKKNLARSNSHSHSPKLFSVRLYK